MTLGVPLPPCHLLPGLICLLSLRGPGYASHMHHSGDINHHFQESCWCREGAGRRRDNVFKKFSPPLLTVNPPVMIPSGNSDYFVNCNTVLAIKWPESLDLKQNSHLEDEEHLDKVIELFTYKALLETRDCKQKS